MNVETSIKRYHDEACNGGYASLPLHVSADDWSWCWRLKKLTAKKKTMPKPCGQGPSTVVGDCLVASPTKSGCQRLMTMERIEVMARNDLAW